MGDLKRAHILISGIVQGVFFRYTAVSFARARNICGWVRNLPDGRVEIVAEGKREDLEEFIKWCWKGPKAAVVKDVQVEFEDYVGEFESFSIRY